MGYAAGERLNQRRHSRVRLHLLAGLARCIAAWTAASPAMRHSVNRLSVCARVKLCRCPTAAAVNARNVKTAPTIASFPILDFHSLTAVISPVSCASAASSRSALRQRHGDLVPAVSYARRSLVRGIVAAPYLPTHMPSPARLR